MVSLRKMSAAHKAVIAVTLLWCVFIHFRFHSICWWRQMWNYLPKCKIKFQISSEFIVLLSYVRYKFFYSAYFFISFRFYNYQITFRFF